MSSPSLNGIEGRTWLYTRTSNVCWLASSYFCPATRIQVIASVEEMPGRSKYFRVPFGGCSACFIANWLIKGMPASRRLKSDLLNPFLKASSISSGVSTLRLNRATRILAESHEKNRSHIDFSWFARKVKVQICWNDIFLHTNKRPDNHFFDIRKCFEIIYCNKSIILLTEGKQNKKKQNLVGMHTHYSDYVFLRIRNEMPGVVHFHNHCIHIRMTQYLTEFGLSIKPHRESFSGITCVIGVQRSYCAVPHSRFAGRIQAFGIGA